MKKGTPDQQGRLSCDFKVAAARQPDTAHDTIQTAAVQYVTYQQIQKPRECWILIGCRRRGGKHLLSRVAALKSHSNVVKLKD